MIGDYYIWIYELEYEVNQNFIVKVINDEEQIVISSNDNRFSVGQIVNFGLKPKYFMLLKDIQRFHKLKDITE